MSRALSIPKIIRQHPREPLFLQPLEWGDRHLELLGCSFKEDNGTNAEDELDGNMQEHSINDVRPYDYYTQAAQDLATSDTKNTAVIQLLAGPEGPFKLHRSYGFFHYRTKYEFRLHGANFTFCTKHKSPSSPKQGHHTSNKACVFAFMQRRMIRMQRENLYPIRRNRRFNEPVETLRQRRLAHIEPSNHYQDPYIFAVLIGLAQSQAKVDHSHNDMNGHRKDRVYQTGALYVDEDPQYMRLYTCPISAAFLSTFEYPEDHEAGHRRHAKPGTELIIRYRKIAFQPYATLQERLLDQVSPLITNTEKEAKEGEKAASEKMKLSGVLFNL